MDLETLVSLAKRRGFVFPSSDIYGGLSGFYDYGPYGVQMLNNLKSLWWNYFVRQRPNIYGVDSAIIQNPKLWKASGHIDGFIDPMVECKKCKGRFKEEQVDVKKPCPSCKAKDSFTKPKNFNLMMKTHIGAVEDDSSVAYLRPETAGGMFTNYELVRETTRAKIPFGIGQIGKAFRNEISPRDFIFRVREIEQMELQYFVNPKEANKEFDQLKEFTWRFFVNDVGLKKTSLKWHEHNKDERAHYAAAAFDIQFKFPIGFKELAGVHNRTDFDLKSHSEASGKTLEYFDPESNKKYIPHVMESSPGLGRLLLAALADAYTEEEVKGDKRVVLKLAPQVAPVDIAILPLSKNDKLTPLAQKVYKLLVEETPLLVEYDDSQSIGKRYRRQDEIGTPQCITIDFDSLEDDSVTIRDRDTMKQERVKIAELINHL